MKLEIEQVTLHYIDYGKKEGIPLVFLHGWGQNIEMMKPIADPFQKDFRIIILDLPGFGESTEPNIAWNLYDYIKCIHQFLETIKVKNPCLLGHSFGGKLSLLYGANYPVKKLVIFASPYKKERTKTNCKTKILKKLKKIPVLNQMEEFAKKHIGSTDYKNASPMMRQILVNHVNCDITNEIKKIKVPTLLIWGSLDEAVPLKQAYEIEALLEDAGVVVFENCTHYAYLENSVHTIQILRNFL